MIKLHIDNRRTSITDIFDLYKDQINISIVNSTTNIVAWHMHKKQIDYFYCIKGSFQIGLALDNEFCRFDYISDKDSTKFIKIIPYTYHGYRSLEPGSILLYYLTEKYDPKDIFTKPVGYFNEDWSIPNV